MSVACSSEDTLQYMKHCKWRHILIGCYLQYSMAIAVKLDRLERAKAYRTS